MINKVYVLSFSSAALLILLLINISQIDRHHNNEEKIKSKDLLNLKKIYSSNYLDNVFIQEAYIEAQIGLSEGGIPIGSVLVVDGNIIGRGHNQRVQKANPILHGVMDALQNAGRRNPKIYQKATLYTTLSPCAMCTGAILLYQIPRVVIGDNKNFNAYSGGEDLLREKGVEVIVLNEVRCEKMMKDYIDKNLVEWEEDIAECKSCHKHKHKDYKNVYDNFNYNRETNQEYDSQNKDLISLKQVTNSTFVNLETSKKESTYNNDNSNDLKKKCEWEKKLVKSKLNI